LIISLTTIISLNHKNKLWWLENLSVKQNRY